VSAIVNLTSAVPYTITTGVDSNGDRNVNERPVVNGVMVPLFSARGDSFSRVDMRISRRFRFGGRSIEVLWEMNNLFNTVNYAGYQGNMKSVSFGQPSYALTPFQGQIGFRLDF
jgi:hypothetical protein